MAQSEPPPFDPESSPTVTALGIATPSGTLRAGHRLGAYVIESRIATGGMGVVYRAMDVTLERPVALKVLAAGATADARQRFLREVQVVAGLVHPHVVALYAAGEDQGHAFAAMELLPGSLAHELARRGRLPWRDALLVVRDACLGLDAGWSRGIVHRDVKPSNLMRDAAGGVKVADFGLAKDISRDLDLTAPGLVLGTPLYVSPEQAAGKRLDFRADLYSLGATLFHFLTGHPPFTANTPLELIVRHAVEPPPRLGDEFPSGVRALVARLLDKDPGRRFASYAELQAEIAAVLDRGDEAPAAAPRPTLTDSKADPLAASQLAAARAAMDLGRSKRAKDILERLVGERSGVWADASFLLATVHEESGDLATARGVLERVAAETVNADVRAFAFWSLGKVAEAEAGAAVQRAIAAYAQVLEVSSTAFPKALLEARIERLKRRMPGGQG
jgi:tetratricopeptide (TPR) repeat protein